MNKPILVAFLLVVLAALLSDITIHTLPVHAQSSTMVYIDGVAHHIGKQSTQLAIKGSEVVGFSCANGDCYILSK